MTRFLCRLLGVSISGYYRWVGAEETRQQHEYEDEKDVALVKEHFDALRGKVVR
jgi:putative transposase